jgi:hypothetical protein
MSPENALDLAQVVLAVHLASAGFIVFGLIAIPLGALLRWQFVNEFWWRLLHMVAMGAVAIQKLLGNSCFLTIWEVRLLDVARRAPHPTPFFQAFGERILYVNLPLSFFVVLYTALWLFVIFLWFRVPPRLHSQAGASG